MKKLVVLVLVFALASLANASLMISVNGVVHPPSSQINIAPSQELNLDITGDGLTINDYAWLIAEGPGTTGGGRLLYTGDLSALTTYAPGTGDGYEDLKAWLEGEGMPYQNVNGITYALFASGLSTPPSTQGTLADNIIFHCTAAPGDVTISLVKIVDERGDGGALTITPYDSVIIHQIPEPITMALLGLGGLFLRRRIA